MTDAAGSWVDATIAGFRAMGASRYADAATYWLGARAALASADAHDPWRAAGQTNAGAAYLLLRRHDEADAALAEAERIWMRLLNDIATADVTLPGRSSSFHFSLASRNLQAFQDVERGRYVRQCEAGLAITRFNRSLLDAEPTSGDALIPDLASVLSDAVGARAVELRLVRATDPASEPADALYADKAAELAARYAPAVETLADGRRRLEAAVALTVLIRPGLGLETADAVPRA